MQSIKAGINQSLFDVAIQETGDIETTFDIAKANSLALDAELSCKVLIIPVDIEVKSLIVKNYHEKGIIPATALIQYAENYDSGLVEKNGSYLLTSNNDTIIPFNIAYLVDNEGNEILQQNKLSLIIKE